MAIYAAMLRGINVSGQKLIKMDRLKAVFESLPADQVKTYIQSGNIVFHSEEKTAEKLREKIEAKLLEALGYAVIAIVRTPEQLAEVIRNTPFDPEEGEEAKLYVSFLSAEPTASAGKKLLSASNGVDDFRIVGREVYIRCTIGYGKSQLSNSFLEKHLGVSATTRNWRTVGRLADMCGEAAVDKGGD